MRYDRGSSCFGNDRCSHCLCRCMLHARAAWTAPALRRHCAHCHGTLALLAAQMLRDADADEDAVPALPVQVCLCWAVQPTLTASNCQPGFENATATHACVPCAAGTFKATNGTGGCAACAPGSYVSEPGARRCQLCPSDFFSPQRGAATLDACIPCADGYHSFPGSAFQDD